MVATIEQMVCDDVSALCEHQAEVAARISSDIEERRRLGQETYGPANINPHDPEKQAPGAYEEALDAATYLKSDMVAHGLAPNISLAYGYVLKAIVCLRREIDERSARG